MADTRRYPMTRADYDAHAMEIFKEGLEQSRKILGETDHMVTRDRTKLVHPDRQEKPSKESE